MKFNKIFEAFPPPKFLNIPFAGLSISDSAIHCIQFGKKDGRIYIEKYAEVELSPGTIVSGEMHDKEKVLNTPLVLAVNDAHLVLHVFRGRAVP